MKVFREDLLIPDSPDTATITSLISTLVKDEWEAIEGYNQAILTLQTIGDYDRIIGTLNDIINEEYIHIGQLEKSIQMVVPSAENIEEGSDEAEEAAEQEELEEDWPEDDIPEDVAEKISFNKAGGER